MAFCVAQQKAFALPGAMQPAAAAGRRCVAARAEKINQAIQLAEMKVVDTLKVDDIDGKSVAMCRCWKSETFPKCNGAHTKWNREVGDNVGPLMVKKED